MPSRRFGAVAVWACVRGAAVAQADPGSGVPPLLYNIEQVGRFRPFTADGVTGVVGNDPELACTECDGGSVRYVFAKPRRGLLASGVTESSKGGKAWVLLDGSTCVSQRDVAEFFGVLQQAVPSPHRTAGVEDPASLYYGFQPWGRQVFAFETDTGCLTAVSWEMVPDIGNEHIDLSNRP